MQVFPKMVRVVPAVLSLRVTVAQSKVTVSSHVFLYQKLRVEPPEGAVNVCAKLLSVVGFDEPASAHCEPP